MKKLSFVIGFGVVLIVSIFALWGSALGVIAGRPTMADMTPPPSPDPNRELIPPVAPTTPPLPSPLTESQALERAFYFDTIGGVKWVEPWTVETIISNPERIQLSLHNSRAEAAKARGQDIWFDADLEKDAGQVWAITIQGAADASLAMPHMAEGMLVDGVTYDISARTGELLGMSTGPFIEQK